MANSTNGRSGNLQAPTIALLAAVLAATIPVSDPQAQSLLYRTPNVAGSWTLPRWSPVFVLTHRFEPVAGGDELINIPTLQLAVGLPTPRAFSAVAGVDYSSNSESVPARAGGNESQWWLRVALPTTGPFSLALTGAYNTAAHSTDGAASLQADLGHLTLLAEARGFTSRFGDDGGGAAAVGASMRLTRYLAVQGDVGSAFTDGVGDSWSAGLAVSIPGSPHTFSLHATNAGTTTLQGASRNKLLGPRKVRYGFVFTIPFGGAERWRRVFAGDPRSDSQALREHRGDTVTVSIKDLAFTQAELRVQAGTVVEWRNDDPVVHTATASDRSWNSGFLQPGQRWSRRFDEPGRYEYHCTPHPQMTAVVVVEG